MADANKHMKTFCVHRMRELLDYDPETGLAFWRPNARRVGGSHLNGMPAGHLSRRGYKILHMDGVLLQFHRAAWAYVHGEWPQLQIDHINGDKSDNRIANLRLATFSQNNRNSKPKKDNRSGIKGLHYRADRGVWRAVIQENGKLTHLGHFSKVEDAKAAYETAAERIAGDFAYHKRQAA